MASCPHWAPFLDLLKEHGFEDLVSTLLIAKTPSGGRHLIYRHLGEALGNQKLARGRGSQKATIETRGEGGYIATDPTPGYKLVQGSWDNIPVISADDRDFLLTLARYLDEGVIVQERLEAKVPIGDRPGDVFNSKGPSPQVVLEEYGWTEVGRNSRGTLMRRPGKDRGWSACIYADSDIFYCFTSSSEFEPSTSYSKFSVLATLKFNRDYIACAQYVRELGYRNEHQRLEDVLATQAHIANNAKAKEERESVGWVRASEVDLTEVAWLWEPYVPLGDITLCAGDPGIGKSTTMQALATAVTIGGSICGKGVPQGTVIFMSAEQAKGSVTVPRFKQMGANLHEIILPDDENEDGTVKPFTLDFAGIEVLDGVCERFKPKLIVIDTITAYIEGGRDMNTSNQVREWMRRLNVVARHHNCAIVCIAHLNKSSQQKGLYRIVGSIDFVGASRSVLLVGRDPDSEQFAVCHEKSNVGPKGKSVGYQITDTGEFGWTKLVDIDSERMFEPAASKESRSKRVACAEWMEQLFAGDVELSGASVQEEGKTLGFGRNMIMDVKKDLGIRAIKQKFGGDGGWIWTMKPWEDREDS
jgi:hypothetical protein